METNNKEIKDTNSQPISIGLGFIFIDVIFFMLMTMFNIASIKYVCAVFMISSIVVTEVINRTFPKSLNVVDAKLTPATSAALGNKVVRMGISYTMVEAVVVAILLNVKVSLNLAFFIQLSLLIIYVSFIAYHIRMNEEALEKLDKKNK